MNDAGTADFYANKSVIVTGGGGFIGSRLCDRLTQLNAEVCSVSRGTQTVHLETGVNTVKCDLSDFSRCQQVLDSIQPDIIFHLASHVVGARDLDVVLSTFHSNLTTTVNLLSVAAEMKCNRVVLTGSLEEPTPNNDWSVPSSPYAAAKLASSDYGRMFNALYGLSVVNMRVFMVYGPGQLDLKKLVPYVITSLLSGNRPTFSSGTREIDWVFVEDVVDAYLMAGANHQVEGQTFDVGSGEFHSVKEVVSTLFDLMGQSQRAQFGDVADRALEQTRLADTERTYQELGWKAQTNLQEGLQTTIDWYKRFTQP